MKTTKKKQNLIVAPEAALTTDLTLPADLLIEIRQQAVPLLDKINPDFPTKANSGSLIYAKLLTLPDGNVARTVKVMPGQKVAWRSSGSFEIIYPLIGGVSPFAAPEGDDAGPNLRKFQSSAEFNPTDGTRHYIRTTLLAIAGGGQNFVAQPYTVHIRLGSDTRAEDELVVSATLQY